MNTIPIKAFHVYVIFLVFGLLITHSTNAQSVSGITHVRDTSYTTWSAYNSTLKTHPNIKIVQEFHANGSRNQVRADLNGRQERNNTNFHIPITKQ